MKDSKKRILYLGKLTWVEAIGKASELGMHVPDYIIMNAIIKRFRTDSDFTEYSKYTCSTTAYINTHNFVDPHEDIDDNWKEIPSIPKETTRMAYAISIDLTIDDVERGDYTLTTHTEH